MSKYTSNQSSNFQGKHSTVKHISKKQLLLIGGLANQQNINANDLAIKLCNKEIHNCSSADANKIIQSLKS